MSQKRLTPTARKLRADPTDAEKALWARLRGAQLGARFTRQFPIGNAVVDFACQSAKLAIELDGGQHAGCAADAERTRLIEAHGYTVLRFWNHEVLANIDGVLAEIMGTVAISRGE